MCGFDEVQRVNYFRGEPISRSELEIKVKKIKIRKAAGKDKVTREMIKWGCCRIEDWICRLCNMVFESGVVLEDWRSTVIVPRYKSKGDRSEYSN